jgi:hypothetical protein
MARKHTFHIPVMGIGFTIDTPFKVAYLGIDSVISIVDDLLLEKMRKMYCEKFNINYEEISDEATDSRAKRITSYLNLIGELIEKKFSELRDLSAGISPALKEYFDLLPDGSKLKLEFERISKALTLSDLSDWLKKNLSIGSIDVNVMTKIDKVNYSNKQQLPSEFNDAHAALRGFANSELSSSIVLSAGMNPRLYSYIEKFEDFYPDKTGFAKKNIILKVSDYRSALIQGKFLAKKGLWVSEYRIESGLNCGGHAFATDGYLLGPILNEFKQNRKVLSDTLNEIYFNALSLKQRTLPNSTPQINITAQGGVGTAEEHQFLLDHYRLDSVGWGSPFLLVPEVTSVDSVTLDKLCEAKEDDLYLSNISPLGVPFNSLRNNTKDIEKLSLAEKGRPGSSCPKKFLELNNKEFTDKNICTASRQYQYFKLKQIDSQENCTEIKKEKQDAVIDKSCLCVGLGTSAKLVNEIPLNGEGPGVSVCPGPNLAYFDKKISLKEMVDHIYGRLDIITRNDRPHMFVKELNIYIDYLAQKFDEAKLSMTEKHAKYITSFSENIKDGIDYYNNLFTELKNSVFDNKSKIISDLEQSLIVLNELIDEFKEYKSNAILSS